MKNVWKQTLAMWVWTHKPSIRIETTEGSKQYDIFVLNVVRTRQPSCRAIIELNLAHANLSYEEQAVLSDKIRKATGAEKDEGSIASVLKKSFILPNGKEFSDVAVQTAKALLIELGVADVDRFLVSLDLAQITYVNKGGKYIELSSIVIKKNGVKTRGRMEILGPGRSVHNT